MRGKPGDRDVPIQQHLSASTVAIGDGIARGNTAATANCSPGIRISGPSRPYPASPLALSVLTSLANVPSEVPRSATAASSSQQSREHLLRASISYRCRRSRRVDSPQACLASAARVARKYEMVAALPSTRTTLVLDRPIPPALTHHQAHPNWAPATTSP